MRKIIGLLVVLGLGLAQGFKPSLAVTGGVLKDKLELGLELSLNLPYQPPVGTLRATFDLVAPDLNSLRGAPLVHYFYDLGQGLQVGPGLGASLLYQFQESTLTLRPYLRADVEYDLPAGQSLPIFLGADLGTDFDQLLAHAKLGFRF